MVMNLAKDLCIHGQNILDCGMACIWLYREIESREDKKDNSGSDMLKTAIFAFAYLIYCAPQGGELHDLCSALDAKASILKLKGIKDLDKVASEVGEQLLGKNWWHSKHGSPSWYMIDIIW